MITNFCKTIVLPSLFSSAIVSPSKQSISSDSALQVNVSLYSVFISILLSPDSCPLYLVIY